MEGDDSASSAHHVKKLMLSYTCNHLMDECDVVNEVQDKEEEFMMGHCGNS